MGVVFAFGGETPYESAERGLVGRKTPVLGQADSDDSDVFVAQFVDCRGKWWRNLDALTRERPCTSEHQRERSGEPVKTLQLFIPQDDVDYSRVWRIVECLAFFEKSGLVVRGCNWCLKLFFRDTLILERRPCVLV